jgi:hypothetical protein
MWMPVRDIEHVSGVKLGQHRWHTSSQDDMRLAALFVVSLTPAATFAQPAATPPTTGGAFVQADLGLGVLNENTHNHDPCDGIGDGWSSTQPELLGALEIGTWWTPSFAISLRIVTGWATGLRFVDGATGDGIALHEYIGPTFRKTVSPHLSWGGGIGFGHVDSVSGSADQCADSDCALEGVTFEGRVGYTLQPSTRHTVELSAEVLLGFLDNSHIGRRDTSLAILVGYRP